MILAQIASAGLLTVVVLGAAVTGRPEVSILGMVPFVGLQVPLLLQSIRARESFRFLLALLPLALLRNLAWGLGGCLSVVRTLARPAPRSQPA